MLCHLHSVALPKPEDGADIYSVVFSPQWLGIVTVAVLYNVLVIVGRTVFWELQNLAPRVWFTLDYICDSLYLLDMAVKAHESE